MKNGADESSKIGVVCGSVSDFETLKPALQTLEEFDIQYTLNVRSAHRTPDDMREYALDAEKNGYKVIIACAGGAVDLSGMIAAYTLLPVIGLPVRTPALNGLDSLYSMVQMPEGIPVGVVGIDRGKNAALLAVEILAVSDSNIKEKLRSYRNNLTSKTRLDSRKEITKLKKELRLDRLE